MLEVMIGRPRGVLLRGWSAVVDDYAIAGGWIPDGKVFLVGDASGGVYAFDGGIGSTVWTHQGAHEGGLLSLDIHPSGAKFATVGQDGRVLIWGVAEGKVRNITEVGKGWVENVAWSPDGQWLAVSCSRKVHVYDAEGRESWHSDDHPSTVSAIAWSSKGELATACYGRVTFFDASNGETLQLLEWKGSLISMVLSPDGEVVACGCQDNSVHFWRRSTEEDSQLTGYLGKPSSLAFDDTSTLLATGGGDVVTVWSFSEEGPEDTMPGVFALHRESITALAFTHEMRLASGGRDGSVVIWTLESNGEGYPVGGALLGDVVAGLHWRSDGRALAALDARGGVTAWQVRK